MKLFPLIVTILLTFLTVGTVYSAPYVAYKSTFKEGELIVRFKDPLRVAKSVSTQKSTVLKKFRHIPLHHIKLAAGVTVYEAMKGFKNDPNVLYVEPNYTIRKSVVPNDPSYGAQWGLPLISAPLAWNSYTGPGVAANSIIVAVLDTGVAYIHPDLAPNLWTNPGEICGNGFDDDNNGIVDDCFGANFGGMSPGNPWDDDTLDSHGTHVSGIIGAVGNNSVGISGLNWSVRLMAIKFLHGPDGVGELADALRGVEYAISMGAKIINMSFEIDEDTGSLRDAVTVAENAGVLIISAAGNTGKNLDHTSVFPASIRSPLNIAVAASTRTDGLPYYSDYGRHTVELSAPGGVTTGSADAVLSTVWLNNGSTLYRTTAGTSMAVPHVTGAAALVWNRNPMLSARQVKARILNGVDLLPAFAENTISGGRLNLANALISQDIPTVFNVSPFQLGWLGGTITVTGSNFGATPGSITLGGVNLTTTIWSDTEITATVPQNSSGGIVQVNGVGSGFPVTVLPLITLTATPASGSAPLAVELNAAILSGASINKYEWDLGDGIFRETAGVTSKVTHLFTIAGTYYVRFRITDSNGNTGSENLIITVAESISSGSGGGGCFIATAAYGSYLHPKVQLLRDFRDSYLLTNVPGRTCVNIYYRLSPPIADFITKHEIVRIVFRWVITPLVLAIAYPTMAMVIIFINSSVVGILFWCRRKKRNLLECDESSNY